MYSFKHIHNYINKLRKTSLSFSSFATFYLAFRNKAIQRKVKKVITVFMKINEGIFISSTWVKSSSGYEIFISLKIQWSLGWAICLSNSSNSPSSPRIMDSCLFKYIYSKNIITWQLLINILIIFWFFSIHLNLKLI